MAAGSEKTVVRGPVAKLLESLAGAGASEAAALVARPDAALARELERLGLEPARAVADVYEALAGGRDERRRAGVFYTPPAIVEAMLDRVPREGHLLDPAAGAGAFVLALARRLGLGALDRLHACDVDGAALDAAALALEALFGEPARARVEAWRRTNAHALDFLRAPWPGPPPDLVVGNPPYGIDNSPDLPGLFPELAGERDLYACFLLRALDVVRPDGTVALLVPDTWLTNARAPSLRRALAARGLARLVDFGKPFAGARDTRVHAVVLRRGSARCEVESTREGALRPMAPVEAARLRERAETGWFLYRTTREAAAVAALERRATRLGGSFAVLYGLRTGDNARHVAAADGPVRLVGGEDLSAYDRTWRPKSLREPDRFRRELSRQLGRWKVGVQRIRTNSRVPWRRWVEAALVPPDEAGLDSLSLLAEPVSPLFAPPAAQPSPRLLALMAVLCSAPLNRWYRLTFTDVNVKPAYLEELPLPPLDDDLAALAARRLAAPGDLALERAADRLVADAYGLSDEEVDVLEEGFWGAERAARPLPGREQALALARAAATPG